MFARRHVLRCKTVVLVIMSLLFSQLALAAYVCPAEASPVGMAEMMAAGMPCEGADAAQPGLCHQHAVDVARLFELAQAASPSLPAVIQVLLIPATPDIDDAVAMPPASTPEAQPPPDPIFLSTLRLRV
jgi:enoyl-CoA hydratase/carnithine racemase